uniref:Uncharacterized protein n=1 Tax=Arundo donax TaxID=35708 RepID=A0A0A8ZJI8_ARUDO
MLSLVALTFLRLSLLEFPSVSHLGWRPYFRAMLRIIKFSRS